MESLYKHTVTDPKFSLNTEEQNDHIFEDIKSEQIPVPISYYDE